VLAHPPHGGNTIAEAGGNFASAFALVVKVKYPLTHRNRYGFHANTLPPRQPPGKLHHLCKRSSRSKKFEQSRDADSETEGALKTIAMVRRLRP
jgi:hypothetical protein